MEIKIAVKELAQYVCRSGNLTSEYFSSQDYEEGSRLHKLLQKNIMIKVKVKFI